MIRQSAKWTLWVGSILFFIVLLTPWQQTAVGVGRVMAFSPGDRIQQITANVEGRVAKWFVREGDKVQEGDLLAKMADNDPEILTRLNQERDALKREIQALEVSLQAAEKNKDRQKKLLADGIASERSYELSQIEYARYVKDRADTEGKLARLDVRIARQLMLEIRAPREGVIQSIRVGENGALVKPADVIALMVPATTERTVELSINGVDLPFIRVGQKVQIQFEGWPIFQFSGLPDLAIGTFTGIVKIIDPSDDGKGNFRVLVGRGDEDLWPSSELLRQGVRARGWVQMNQVPLWFEIWRQINGLPPMPVPLQALAKDKVGGSKSSDDVKKDDGDKGY
jgi:multidrug efflux pump subunit AcrA (membrane-fusion protein)